MTRTTVLLLAICFGLAAASRACFADPSGTPHIYRVVDGRELPLYVTKPADWSRDDRRPCLVFYHGGGWTGGAPGQFTEHVRHFASRGAVCVQVEYRLLDKKTDGPPDQCIHDARSAMRWVRSHADQLGIDPMRIATGGGSAGGHLAAHVGLVDGIDAPDDNTAISSKSQALLLFNPVYDNGPGGWGTKRVGDRYPEISPFHNASPDDPPSIVFLGTEDKLIPVDTGENFALQMMEVGVYSELHLYEGQGHGFFNSNRDGGKWFEDTLAKTDAFLVKLGWLDQPAETD